MRRWPLPGVLLLWACVDVTGPVLRLQECPPGQAPVPPPPQRCDRASCPAGCCDEAGECREASSQSAQACGRGGQACGTCAEGTTCAQGACVGGPRAAPGGCRDDLDCRPAGPGTICEAGLCVPGGVPCEALNECNSNLEGARCNKEDGLGCVCDVQPNPDGGPPVGTCRRRRAPCEACSDDVDCGGLSPVWGPETRGPGLCATLPGTPPDAGRFCFYRPEGGCPCGLVGDRREATLGFCLPRAGASCDDPFFCLADADCGAASTCLAPDGGCGGQCLPRCRWDAALRRELPESGTSGVCQSRGLACWVGAAADEGLVLSPGVGRCLPPCASDAECGRGLACVNEVLPGGGRSLGRCRPALPDGGVRLLDDAECTEGQDAPQLGFVAEGACRYDACRSGVDVRSGLPFGDCRPGFTCQGAGQAGVCRLTLRCGPR